MSSGNLTRYRKSVIEERGRETQRLHKVLEDAGVKLSSVASSVLTKSGQEMIEALIAGQRDPGAGRDGQGLDAGKIPELQDALAETVNWLYKRELIHRRGPASSRAISTAALGAATAVVAVSQRPPAAEALQQATNENGPNCDVVLVPAISTHVACQQYGIQPIRKLPVPVVARFRRCFCCHTADDDFALTTIGFTSNAGGHHSLVTPNALPIKHYRVTTELV